MATRATHFGVGVLVVSGFPRWTLVAAQVSIRCSAKDSATYTSLR